MVSNSAILSSVSARTWRGAFDQTPDLKTLCAIWTALSTSAADAAWQYAKISPFAGSSTASLHFISKENVSWGRNSLTDCSAFPAISFPFTHKEYGSDDFPLISDDFLFLIHVREGKKKNEPQKSTQDDSGGGRGRVDRDKLACLAWK